MLVRNITFRREVTRKHGRKNTSISGFSPKDLSSQSSTLTRTNMSSDISRTVVTFFMKLLAISIVLRASLAAEHIDSLAVSESKSATSDIITPTRHKRAPGWGKRAPGWGKRNDVNNELFEQAESVMDSLNRAHDVTSNAYLPEEVSFSENKRAPGWGKRGVNVKKLCASDAYPSAWLRDRGNAIPHWGKRNSGSAQDDEAIEADKRAPGWGKRAPGWGKRNYGDDVNVNNADMVAGYDSWANSANADDQLYGHTDIFEEPTNSNIVLPSRTLLSRDLFSIGKRATPGWGGKRAPGWGKRNYAIEIVDEDVPTEKRAPGWGKRAPGWGKRAPGWGKRAPGWGKRAPGWGKRAPGWGKRHFEAELDEDDTEKRDPGWGKRAATRVKRSQSSVTVSPNDICDELQLLENAYIARIQELAARRSIECGNTSDANKLFGK